MEITKPKSLVDSSKTDKVPLATKPTDSWARQVSIAERSNNRDDNVNSLASSFYEDVATDAPQNNINIEIPKEETQTKLSEAIVINEKFTRREKKKKNPAYIPKTGYYFEHDSRDDIETKEDTIKEMTESNNNETLSHVEKLIPINEEVSKPAFKPPKKTNKTKVNNQKTSKKAAGFKHGKSFNREIDHDIETHERWIHDRFDMDEQKPKSQCEIVSKYGFDIRQVNDIDQVESYEEIKTQKPKKKQQPPKINEYIKKDLTRGNSSLDEKREKSPQLNNQHLRKENKRTFSNTAKPFHNTENANSVEVEEEIANNSSFNYYEVEYEEARPADLTKLRRQKPTNNHKKDKDIQINIFKDQNHKPVPSKSYYKNQTQHFDANNNNRKIQLKPKQQTEQKLQMQSQEPTTRPTTYQPKHLQLEDSITYNEQRVANVRSNNRGGQTNYTKNISNQIVTQSEQRNNNDSEGPKRYSTLRNTNRNQKINGFQNSNSGQQFDHHIQQYNGYNNLINNYMRPHSYQYNSNHQQIIPQQLQYFYVNGNQQNNFEYQSSQQQHEYAPSSNTIYYNSQNQMIVNNSTYHGRQSRAIPIVNPIGNDARNGYSNGN